MVTPWGFESPLSHRKRKASAFLFCFSQGSMPTSPCSDTPLQRRRERPVCRTVPSIILCNEHCRGNLLPSPKGAGFGRCSIRTSSRFCHPERSVSAVEGSTHCRYPSTLFGAKIPPRGFASVEMTYRKARQNGASKAPLPTVIHEACLNGRWVPSPCGQ